MVVADATGADTAGRTRLGGRVRAVRRTRRIEAWWRLARRQGSRPAGRQGAAEAGRVGQRGRTGRQGIAIEAGSVGLRA